MKFYLLLFCFFACVSCENINVSKETPDTSELMDRSTLTIDKNIIDTDSLQILYFDNPDGDSLRYTRFYTYTSTADTTVLQALFENLKGKKEVLHQMKNCRSEGKIYCYSKGDVIKTIYFNRTNQTCKYLYFIQDGSFVYFTLNQRLAQVINNLKREAVAPAAVAN